MKKSNSPKGPPKPFDGLMTLNCGHVMEAPKYRALTCCPACMLDGNLLEIARNPYKSEFIPRELRDWALTFERQKDETLDAYAERSFKSFQDLNRIYRPSTSLAQGSESQDGKTTLKGVKEWLKF